MVLLLLSRYTLDYVISIYRVTILDFMVQTRPKHLKILSEGRTIKKKMIKSFNITFTNKAECPSVFKSQGIPPFKPN